MKHRKTLKNKLFGLLALGLGITITAISKEGTILIVLGIMGFYLLIAKENCIS